MDVLVNQTLKVPFEQQLHHYHSVFLQQNQREQTILSLVGRLTPRLQRLIMLVVTLSIYILETLIEPFMLCGKNFTHIHICITQTQRTL